MGAHVLLVGALPGLVQEVPLSEFVALVQGVTNSVPDDKGNFSFYTDCMWVIDSYHRGWSSCTGAGHIGSIFWRRFSSQVDEKLGSTRHLLLEKVKAHISLAACGGDNELIYLRGVTQLSTKEQGNGPHFTAPARPPSISSKKAVFAAKEVAMFIGRVGEFRYNRHKDLLDNARKARKDVPAPPRPAAAPLPVRVPQHRACLDPALRWRCAVCLVTANTAKALGRISCVSSAEMLRRSGTH